MNANISRHNLIKAFGADGALVKQSSKMSEPVRGVFILVMGVLASLTVLTHFAQIVGMRFSTYAVAGIFVNVIIVTLVLRSYLSKHIFGAVARERPAALVLLTCCLMGSLLSLFAHRPDSDDAFYLPNVVYYLAHPDEPMGFKIHHLDSGTEPFVSYHWGTSVPFEYSQGILAYVGRMHLLTVYYLAAPALFGFMVPLVWFYLLSRLSFGTRAAIIGAIFICLSLTLMGERHRSFGNFAFGRIFQGKTVLLAVGLPLFVALTIDFFRSPSLRSWLYLFFTSTAMVGCSSSSAMFLGLFSVVLSVACCVSYVVNIKLCFKRVFSYLSTLFYLALYAASVIYLSFGELIIKNPLRQDRPDTISAHAKLVFGTSGLTASFLVVATVVAVIFLKKRDRRFLLAWIISLVVFFLNPFVAPFVIKHVTSQIIYWRLFYLYPFPLVVGIAAAGLDLKLEAVFPNRRNLVILLGAILLLLAHLPSSSPSVFRREVMGSATGLQVPGYKVDGLDQGKRVLSSGVPGGTMLAPSPLAYSLPMLSANYPQMLTRDDVLLMLLTNRGEKEEAKRRIRARNILEGKITSEESGHVNMDCLVWLISRYPHIRSIVAKRAVVEADDSRLPRLLERWGFAEWKSTGDLVVFVRAANYVRE